MAVVTQHETYATLGALLVEKILDNLRDQAPEAYAPQSVLMLATVIGYANCRAAGASKLPYLESITRRTVALVKQTCLKNDTPLSPGEDPFRLLEPLTQNPDTALCVASLCQQAYELCFDPLNPERIETIAVKYEEVANKNLLAKAA